MKAKIIPAVLAKNFQELRSQIEKAPAFAGWIHIDIMDGKFVPNTTWANPQELNFESLPVKVEIHLMVQNPGRELHRWIDAGAERIIFHIEAIAQTDRPEEVFEIIRKCSLSGTEIGIALNPQTSLSQVEAFLQGIDLIQIMGVDPGFTGQPFQEKILDKIKALRLKNQDILVSVDGGIDNVTASKAVKAGADILVSHSFILDNPNPQKAFEQLSKVV